MGTNNHAIKMDKWAGVTEMVLCLDELDNTDNLVDRNLSNVLLMHYMTCSEEFTSLKPVGPQYKRLRNREFPLPNFANNRSKGQHHNQWSGGNCSASHLMRYLLMTKKWNTEQN